MASYPVVDWPFASPTYTSSTLEGDNMNGTPSWYLDIEADEAELDRRIREQSRKAQAAPTFLYVLANYHTGEVIEITSAVPQWFIDELTAIGGYVRFDNFDAATIFFSACKADEEAAEREVDELISQAGDDRRERRNTAPMRYLEDFVARCASDCVEGR